MTTLDAPTAYRSYQVPRHDRGVLIDPSPRLLGPRFADNQAALRGVNLELAGQPLNRWQDELRAEVLRAAVRHTSVYRDYTGAKDSQRIVMAGHQPELFHPGVWLKNFALSRFAGDVGATAINFIVDHDLASSRGIDVPQLVSRRAVRRGFVDLDRAGPVIPWEMHRIADRDRFDSFATRVGQAMRPWVDEPCIGSFWSAAREAADRCANLGCAVASGRHELEARLGLQTLELPLSSACRTHGFFAFAVALLSEMPRFHACYNAAVEHYRGAHGIRSQAHPVPRLGESDGWLESPFWVYGSDDPQRRGIWVRLRNDTLELSDRRQRAIKLVDVGNETKLVRALHDQCGPNFQLRPRALTTTMFARLMLSDLFLHGIGGGKYDQLTDRIIEQFFGIQPPGFMVLSGTVRLPGVSQPKHARAIQEIDEQIRQTYFNPQRFADRVAMPAAAVEAFSERLRSIPPRGKKQRWHDSVTALRAQLSARLSPLRGDLRQQRDRLIRQSRSQQVLASREWSFALYPLEMLADAERQMLKQATQSG